MSHQVMSGVAFADSECAMIGGTDESYDNPDTFQGAWNHHNEADKDHWRTVIRNKFNNMLK